MRLYSDASHDEDVIGIAYVIRDDFEDIEVVGKQAVHGNFTSMEAEYNAMMSGIHAASWYGGDDLLVLTDCEPLVDKMYYPDADSQKWYEMRHDCHTILNTFEDWTMRHVKRHENSEADRLAKEALWSGRRNA